MKMSACCDEHISRIYNKYGAAAIQTFTPALNIFQGNGEGRRVRASRRSDMPAGNHIGMARHEANLYALAPQPSNASYAYLLRGSLTFSSSLGAASKYRAASYCREHISALSSS